MIVKLRAGRYMVPVDVVDNGKTLTLKFSYNKILLTEVKDMDGARWNPELKCWTINNTQRNQFQLDYLQGKPVYDRYDSPLHPETLIFTRPLYEHQKEMVAHGLTRHCCMLACEMGTGKTLSAIEVIERSGFNDWWWVGPKSALRSVELDFEKWGAKVTPRFMTYDELKKIMSTWPPGKKAPQGVVFDESARVKTPTSQRSEAAMALANGVRQDCGDNGYVILMTGTPAPKSPIDWWMQCEIACPGFLKEGNIHKFKNKLALIKQEENSITGGMFPRIVAWRDNDHKCEECGYERDHKIHGQLALLDGVGHKFVPMVNEVARLYKRLQGLALVKFKKDCLSLPDKIYEIVRLKPSPDVIRAARLISQTAPRAVTALQLLRELSDGFQYKETEVGEEVCSFCQGKRTQMTRVPNDPTLKFRDDMLYLGRVNEDTDEFEVVCEASPENTHEEERSCDRCNGTGVTKRYENTTVEFDSPKDQLLSDLLDEHEEIGRLVTYAGFTGSIDRCCKLTREAGWDYIRVDGRGWSTSLVGYQTPKDMLRAFQDKENDFKINFIGHPASAGEGLTLTASPTIFYFSNDFNGMARTQSEDRIHRIGMDVNRGARIIDVIHLPTDELVLNNLKKKRELETMSMGELRETLNTDITVARRA